ncbi:HlyD family efflux transporter periplasmic adaptor subunit [Paraherbaspirillum soli]|uniref:HlyD family efflux transporter periplasmic adaptor subunit n=1 Tax=Paraherbaspirillum soli TaxID=631222 RepID=A0ABW0MEN9_9BURK
MLPALRQDLSLHPGPAAADGAPTWTLHDPAANRFYRLGWAAFEMLSRWPLNDPQAILDAVNRDTTLQVDGQDLLSLLQFLSGYDLLEALGPTDTQRLATAARAAKLSRMQWLLKNYLFFRLPLVRPAAFLNRCAPYVQWAFDPRFWLAIAVAALFGLVLAARQWDQFLHTFSAYNSLTGWLAIGAALSFAKLLHELGHAFTAQRYGCRVPTMGVAFLVLLPVLYTDTNEAWKLPDKRQRLAIAAAGMLAELALAAVATLAWNFLPDGPVFGPLKAGAFLLATTSWLLTLGVNASPFMRFDGYFLLSDWLDLPNLHSRAFALGRWWLRRQLFGWDDPPPEIFAPGRQRFLIAFALATWIYRLVVFLGIAFLVYHIAFKLLGIVLLLIELGWFIALPIVAELKTWWRNKDAMHWNRASRRSALIAAALLAVILLPWSSEVRAPAVLGAAEAQGLYAVSAARVVSPPVAVGTEVQAGQVLVQLESLDLRYRLAQEQNRERLLHWELEQQPFDPKLQQEGSALRERWTEAAASVGGLQQQVEQLIVRAPFAGRVAEANDSLAPGAWIAAKEKLFEVIAPHGAKAEALVGETALPQLQAGGRATFIADAAELHRAECRVDSIDRVNLAAIDSLYLASTYGGPIPVQKDRHGALVPTAAWYRVRLDQCGGGAPARELRGVMHLHGAWSSIAGTYLRRAITLVQRELSF